MVEILSGEFDVFGDRNQVIRENFGLRKVAVYRCGRNENPFTGSGGGFEGQRRGWVVRG